MKNKLIWLVFVTFLSSNSIAHAEERTISSMIKEIHSGTSLEEELKNPVVSAGDYFLFIKKDEDNALALYAIGSSNYETFDGLAFIYVKVEKNHFYVRGEKLLKGKYKLVSANVLSVKNEFPNAGAYDILQFERVK